VAGIGRQEFSIGGIRTQNLPLWIVPLINLAGPYTTKPTLEVVFIYHLSLEIKLCMLKNIIIILDLIKTIFKFLMILFISLSFIKKYNNIYYYNKELKFIKYFFLSIKYFHETVTNRKGFN
jgi:hypothetical protein